MTHIGNVCVLFEFREGISDDHQEAIITEIKESFTEVQCGRLLPEKPFKDRLACYAYVVNEERANVLVDHLSKKIEIDHAEVAAVRFVSH